MKQKRCYQHAPELLAEITRIVELKKQIPRYADVAAAHGVSAQIVRRLIFERMPVLRTKVLFHAKQQTKVRGKTMTREELDRLAAQLARSSL
jgi:hypothetical protein